MEGLFYRVLHMSLSASLVIAVVLLVRLLLSGAPKKWSYLLWSAVGFRLCCPVSFRAAFSLFSVTPLQVQRVQIILPAAPVNAVPAIEPAAVPTSAPEISSAFHLWPTLGIIFWIAGMATLFVCSLVQVMRLRSRLLDAVQSEHDVWQSDRVSTPFIMGLLRPKIYVPIGTDAETLRYVLAHERVHLRRADHWIKALAFLLLTVYWFNPLCWLAFLLMNRDMELSCDERVLAENGSAARAYSLSLLRFAAPGRFPSPGMLAFGESDVKRRVKNALQWKRPKRWATILAALLCVAAVAACVANPKDNAERESIRNVAMQASRLSSSQSCVVDSNGALLPGIVETYEKQLRNVFTEDSGYISQYTEIMQQIVSSFDNTTDVVLDHQVMECKIRKLSVEGDQATLTCRIKSLQKYIPHRENGGYAVVFAASKETVTYTLQKSGGIWRVQSFTSDGYVFGAPKEMGFAGKYEEKTFPTREEACRYAASVPSEARSNTAADESAAVQRMRNLQGEDILHFAGSFSATDPNYNDTVAAAIRNAVANDALEEEEPSGLMEWYFADLYLSMLPSGGFGTGSEMIHFGEDLTVPIVHVRYENPDTQVEERLKLEDETLYWLIRNTYTLKEMVVTSDLAPYWETIHSRAEATVKRIDGLTGYDLTNFYLADTFEDDSFHYDVYLWSAAYKTEDPYSVNFAGGMGLDSQGRVVGLNEEERYFVVRNDGAFRFIGLDLPFGYGDATIRSRNLEWIKNAFAQEPEL